MSLDVIAVMTLSLYAAFVRSKVCFMLTLCSIKTALMVGCIKTCALTNYTEIVHKSEDFVNILFHQIYECFIGKCYFLLDT